MPTNQSDEPMDVLLRSREMPDLPFSGKLRYEGIQVVANIVAVYTENGSTLDIDGFYNRPKSDSIPVSVEVSDERNLGDEIYDENVSESVGDLISMWTQAIKDKYEYVLYKPNDAVYVVSVGFHFCYLLHPDNCTASFECRESRQYRTLPDSTPDNRIEGRISDVRVLRSSVDGDRVQFESTSFFTNLIGGGLEIELELIEVRRAYDLYELKDKQHIEQPQTTEEGDYCSADIKVSNGDYIIKCNHDEGPVNFRFELTKFGTLPEWVEKRLDIDTLLNQLDQNGSVMAELKPAQEDTDDKWISELGDMELVAIR